MMAVSLGALCLLACFVLLPVVPVFSASKYRRIKISFEACSVDPYAMSVISKPGIHVYGMPKYELLNALLTKGNIDSLSSRNS